jgi:hypothetical protein
MIPTLVSAVEYLPTDPSPFNSLTATGFIIAGFTVLVAFSLLAYAEDALPSLCLITMALAIAIGPYAYSLHQVSEQNQAAITKNIKAKYDLETVIFDGKVAYPKQETIQVTVTHDGKSAKVTLSEDKETFEPTLSSFDNDVNIGEWKRPSVAR